MGDLTSSILKFANVQFITDVIFDVEASTPNPYPVLLLPENRQKLFCLELHNEGWGEMRDVVIRFNLVPLGQSIFSNESYQHTIASRQK